MLRHHRQQFYESAQELLRHEAPRLRNLIGKTIDAIWVAYDQDGDWVPDEAIIFVVDDVHLEIGVYQTGLMALTWNTVDLTASANWLGCWEDGEFHWRKAIDNALQSAVRQRILRLSVVDCDNQFESGVFALQLQLESSALVVYNALDELGVRTTLPEGQGLTTFEITS